MGQWTECVLRYRKVCWERKERALKFSMDYRDHDWIDSCRLVGSQGGNYRKTKQQQVGGGWLDTWCWLKGCVGHRPQWRVRMWGSGMRKMQNAVLAPVFNTHFFFFFLHKNRREKSCFLILAWGHPYLNPKITINQEVFFKNIHSK